MSKPQPGDPEDYALEWGFGPRIKVGDNVWDGSVSASHPMRVRRITRLYLEPNHGMRILLANPNRFSDDMTGGSWLAVDEAGWKKERARYLQREIEEYEQKTAKLRKEMESLEIVLD